MFSVLVQFSALMSDIAFSQGLLCVIVKEADRVFAQSWRARQRIIFLENFYYRLTSKRR